MIKAYFKSKDNNFYLLKGDTMELLPKINHEFDMVFADPPYFLSNNGLSIQNGQVVSVNKGKWDKSNGFDYINSFNRRWLKLVREFLTPPLNDTTYRKKMIPVIFSGWFWC